MRYYVTLDPSPGADPVIVDLQELPSGALDARVDGRVVKVDFVSPGTLAGQLSVRVDGKIVDLTTEGVPPDMGAVASGHRSYVRVESERQRSADAAKKGGNRGGDLVIKAPMPGRIIKVLVAKGDQVAIGQPILVMEAMKMENEIKAKASATISEVHVSVGAAVEANSKLVTLV